MDFSVKEYPGSPRVSYLGVNLNPFSFLNEYKLRERNIKHFGQYAFLVNLCFTGNFFH